MYRHDDTIQEMRKSTKSLALNKDDDDLKLSLDGELKFSTDEKGIFLSTSYSHSSNDDMIPQHTHSTKIVNSLTTLY